MVTSAVVVSSALLPFGAGRAAKGHQLRGIGRVRRARPLQATEDVRGSRQGGEESLKTKIIGSR